MSECFSGPEEEVRALIWMKNRLADVRKSGGRNLNHEQLDSLVDLINEIKSRENELKVEGGTEEDEFHENLWERFIYACSGKWIDEQKSTWEPPFEWGEWEFTQSQRLDIGYSEHLKHTYVPRGGGSAKHYYSNVPDSVVWELTPLVQKGLTFFIGKARVAEIDAVCSVPQLPAEMDSAETAKRVLDPSRGQDEWQRRVDSKRLISIRNFIGHGENLIANSAILYAPEHGSVEVETSGTVRVDFGQFLDEVQGDYCDHKGKTDLRPIWLIDGQHRTRGLAQSTIGIELEIPIILFPPEFSLSQSAKIFSEINTLQKKLSALHTLYMQHRFGIPSPLAKRDFTHPWVEGNVVTNKNSRANHLAYECAAFLAANEDGPLFNRIKILDQNASNTSICQASQWVDFSRGWFAEGMIYGPLCPENQETINAEVENFFSALIETCNHDEWGDNKPRWARSSYKKGLIQRHGPSQAILKIYPTVWKKARHGYSESPISVNRFKEVLKPLKWVDWIDPRLMPTFGRGGERGRTALKIWLANAIEHGEVYPLEEVMADNLKSKAGRGILAGPGNGKVSIEGQHEWPYAGKPIRIIAKQPMNSLPTSIWTIHDENGVDRTEQASIVARNGVAELMLRQKEWMKDIKRIDIRVQWYNTVNPPGHATKKLERR